VRLDGEWEKAEGVGKFQSSMFMNLQIRNQQVTCAGALASAIGAMGAPPFSQDKNLIFGKDVVNENFKEMA